MEREIIQNIIQYSKGKKVNPVKLDLFLTQSCNLRCVFCGCHTISKDVLNAEMQESSILQLIDEALELGIKNFGILGGEPFVKKHLMVNVMERIKQGQASGALTTNGTLFDYQTIQKIVSIKWDMIRFSIDGDNPKTHDCLRGIKGSFKSCIKALETFKRVKEETRTQSPQIEFSTVLCNKNYKELKGIIEIAKALDCKKMYFLPVIELTEHVQKLKLNKKEAKKYIEEAKLFAESQNISTNLGELIKKDFIEKTENVDQIISKDESKNKIINSPCYQPWYGLAVHSNGHVVPCANFTNNEGLSFCNNSLKSIWLDDYFEGVRQKLLKNKFPEACSRCCMPLVEENREIKRKLIEALESKNI
jgi:MoaA/NifB/PqqE/SkfB family radical SAM enzyme